MLSWVCVLTLPPVPAPDVYSFIPATVNSLTHPLALCFVSVFGFPKPLFCEAKPPRPSGGWRKQASPSLFRTAFVGRQNSRRGTKYLEIWKSETLLNK